MSLEQQKAPSFQRKLNDKTIPKKCNEKKNKNEQWALNVCGATKEARCRIPWDRSAAQAAAKWRSNCFSLVKLILVKKLSKDCC